MNEISEYQRSLGKHKGAFKTRNDYFDINGKRIFFPKIVQREEEIENVLKSETIDINYLFELVYDNTNYELNDEEKELYAFSKSIFELDKTSYPELYTNNIKKYITMSKSLLELKKTEKDNNTYIYKILPRITKHEGSTSNEENSSNDHSSNEDNSFKFKNFEECATNKRSAKYYYSKKDLIDAISKNKNLIKTMPKNYKSLTKEALCKNIYKVDKN